ncbi:MAG TPA: TraR/DksA C4-type zinc finger protein [Pirellulaceae bacterium]|nr:TraR/DksA C4-type zinc finger protein [Pirellulaceae bacterium]
MNKTQFLRQTEQRLLARRGALKAALAGDQRMLQTLHESGVGDEIDAAIASQQAELQSQMAEVESRELVQIDQALAKIRAGQYGRCETCERQIAPLRLKYLPYAADCIACARREERHDTAQPLSRPVNRIAAFIDDEQEPAVAEAELELR